MKRRRRFGAADNHMPTNYMAKKNAYEAGKYSQELLERMGHEGGEPLPQWADHKLSVARRNMGDVGHFVESEEALRGRRFALPKLTVPYSEEFDVGRASLRGIRTRRELRRARRHDTFDDDAMTNRQDEAHRMVRNHRMLDYSQGRRYGAPGFVYGQPGWAGQGGVQTFPLMNRRMRRRVMARPAYGSLGYGSMSDGSMDYAVRGRNR